MRKRRLWWLFVAIGASAYFFYPVGGVIWNASQVTGLAMGSGEQRRELQAYKRGVDDALSAARADRVRRLGALIPGLGCRPLTLQFRTADRWVETTLACPSGLEFDTISPDEWR